MKIIKILAKIIFALVIVVLLIIRGFFAYQQFFSLSSDGLQKTFGEMFADIEDGMYTIDDRKIHAVELSNPGYEHVALLIHGAPGSSSDWSGVLQDERFGQGRKIIVVDRLGYGRSGAGISEKSIKKHSDTYMELLQTLMIESDPLPLIVGHSYGATIAAKMIMDYSSKLSGGIVVSGPLSPELEVTFPISHILKYQPLKFLMGPMLRVANDEKLSHPDSLTNEVQNYTGVSKPFIVIHGTKDALVPYGNVEYMKARVSPDYFKFQAVEGADHPLHFTHPEVISEVIIGFFTE